MWRLKVKIVNPKNWLEWRDKGIGSSDAPAVMGMSPWVSPLELWQRRTHRLGPLEQTYPMLHGLQTEPIARELYQENTGIEIPKKLVMHDNHDFVRASLDGLNVEKEKVVEIKCPLGPKDHFLARKGQIPDKYLYQCVHQLMITGFDRLDYFSFFQGEGVLIHLKRDKKLEQKLFKEESIFWECVLKDIPPGKKNLKGEVMNSQNRSPFTAREVVEILQLAKSIGVTHMKLDGFEAAFDLTRPIESEERNSDVRECPECSEPMIEGQYGLYCKACYVGRKEQKKEFFKTRKSR